MYQKPICECGAPLVYSQHYSQSKSFEIGSRGGTRKMINKSNVDFEGSTLDCSDICGKNYEAYYDDKKRIIRGPVI